MAYDALLAAWAGEFGRTDPEASYRRFVAAGLTTPPAPPWAEARHGWLLGSERFLDRLRQRLGDQTHRDLRRERRLLRGLDLALVIEAVCSRYGVDRGQLAARGSRSPARAALAYLAKHHTESTRAELVPILGLSRPESVPNLSARFAALLQSESNARRDLMALERALGLSGENSMEIRCQFIMEIRCQFIIFARKDELKPDFAVELRETAGPATAQGGCRLARSIVESTRSS